MIILSDFYQVLWQISNFWCFTLFSELFYACSMLLELTILSIFLFKTYEERVFVDSLLKLGGDTSPGMLLVTGEDVLYNFGLHVI